MGTSKSGRYLNTKGSGRSVSDFAVVHSNEGDFVWRNIHIKGKAVKQIRLANGGHGQRGMELLDKYGIEYHVTKIYPNGVRVGYVPDHKRKTREQEWGNLGFQKLGLKKILDELENM